MYRPICKVNGKRLRAIEQQENKMAVVIFMMRGEVCDHQTNSPGAGKLLE